jgi:hypothetical protein
MSKHCDDYIDDKTQPECLRRFLRFKRWPAVYQCRARRLGVEAPKLFADWNRYPKSKKPKLKRVCVVMASRFGDVGITTDLTGQTCYSHRVLICDLSNFSSTP